MCEVRSRNDNSGWPAAIRSAKNIMRRIVGLRGGRGFDGQRRFREHSKELREARLHLTDIAAEIIHDLIRRFRYVPKITIERGTKAAQVFVTSFDRKIGEQAVDPFDLVEPEGMNLGWGHIRCGLLSDGLLVASSAVWQTVQPNCGAAMRSVVLGNEFGEAAISGQDFRVHCVLYVLGQALLVFLRNGGGKLLRGR